MNTARYCIIAVGCLIVTLSTLVLGFTITGISLVLPVVFFLVLDYTLKSPKLQNTPVMLLVSGIFMIIAAVISMEVLLVSLFYVIFWAIIVHLWFEHEE